MSYSYKATLKFWKSFYALDSGRKESTRSAWKLFKVDPFHASLNSHKINKLSAEAKTTIFSATIEGNLRVIFRIDGNVVTSLDIGTHDLYK